MKNFYRKGLTFFFAFVFMFSILSINSNAIYDDKVVEENGFIINEWDEYSRIISMTDKELMELGCTNNDILSIRNFDYEAEIRNRAELDDKTLRIYGYTDEEIYELRRAASMEEIPENIIKSISTATMTSKLEYVSNSSRTEDGAPMYYVNMKYSWEWNRIPLFRLIDMVVVAFSSTTGDDFTYFAQTSDKVHADLTALSSSYSTYSQVESWVYSTEKPNSISAKFAIGVVDENGMLTHFAYSGYGTFQLTNRSNNARLYVDACYGHTTINIVPNYSLDFSGLNVAVDFRAGMDEQHCAGVFYESFRIDIGYIYHGTVYGKNNTGGTAT